MRNWIIIWGLFILLSDSGFSQLSGNGTEGNPYSGIITTNTTWATGGSVYADDITIASGCTLTISPWSSDGTWLIMSGGTMTINTGGNFIINPLAAATIYNIINNGILILESNYNEPGVASLLHDNYSGSGVTQSKLYLSGGVTSGGSYIWHYLSLPVSGVSANSFSTLNLAQYVENLATSTDNSHGWIAWDGYQYSSDILLSEYAFNTLSIGKGYNYYSESGSTFTLNGNINISLNTQDLSFSGSSASQGWNLIGNPFSSCLDWEELNPTYIRSIQNAIYFTNRGTYPSYVNGIGTDGGTQFIPPFQGFFVKANALNGRVQFHPSARTHQFDQMRYKKSQEEIIKSSDSVSFVRLQLKSANDSTEAVVRFNNKATPEFDTFFDAHKFSKETGDLNIWTKTGQVDYSINGLPFPQNTVEIAIGLNVKIPGIYRLWSNELNKLDDYAVILRDVVTNNIVDLRKCEFMLFNIPAVMIEDRFILTLSNITTGIQKKSMKEKKFSIYYTSGIINILSLTDEFINTHGSLIIYDLTGRKLYQNNNTEWESSGDLKQIILNPVPQGLCFVEIKAGHCRYVEKISLR